MKDKEESIYVKKEKIANQTSFLDSRLAMYKGINMGEILLGRVLKRVAVPFSRVSSQPRDQTQVSLIAGRFFTS